MILGDQDSFLIVFLLFVMTYDRNFIEAKVVRYSVSFPFSRMGDQHRIIVEQTGK